MIRRGTVTFAIVSIDAIGLLAAMTARWQTKLSPKWEELTAADFRMGVQQSKGTCLLPFGILEKHGPHLPLGTDLLNVRYASQRLLHPPEFAESSLAESVT
jgi:creatinine amidohydrolase